ncbi:MAG: hypothetical protein KDA91_23805 [Planctomycetaceae bacterium]|nr:hypothetical protein [Planctomycetaceae bacterium]
MSRFRSYVFPFLCSIILGVSAYDVWLTVKFSEIMLEVEENPIGLYLLQLNHGDVELFLRAKIAGTVVVMSVLLLMHKWRSRKTIPVTGSLAVYQTGLFTYLTMT